MGGNDRRTRYLKAVAHSVVGTVRDVHNHTQAVHLPHHFAAEGAKTAPTMLSGAGIADLVVCVVRQGHTGHAHPIKQPQKRQGALYRRAVLHTDEDRGQALGLVLKNLGGRKGQLNFTLRGIHLVIEMCEHIDGIARRLVRSEARRAVQRENGGVDSPCPELREVDVPPSIILGKIARAHHLGRRIAMRIKYKHNYLLALE